jgi:uncharacterized membrane protein
MKLQLISVPDPQYSTEMEIDGTETVEQLKQKLPIKDVRLIYSGKLLVDSQILSEAIKEENGFVHVVLKPTVAEPQPEPQPEPVIESRPEPTQVPVEPTPSIPFSYSLVPIAPKVITIKY